MIRHRAHDAAGWQCDFLTRHTEAMTVQRTTAVCTHDARATSVRAGAMPPKKKKASKKGGSRRESIAGSLGDQMKDLKRKLDESEMMLQEEQKVRERVGREKAGMLQQLASLEAALHQEQARHEEVVLRLERENARRSGLLTERIANLTNHRKELEQSLQSYALVESEHTRLCHVVNTLKEEVEAEVRLHTDEEKGLREDAFNMRMQLENVRRLCLCQPTQLVTLGSTKI